MHSSWQISIYSDKMACVRISGDCESYQMVIPDQRPYKQASLRQQGKWLLDVPYRSEHIIEQASR